MNRISKLDRGSELIKHLMAIMVILASLLILPKASATVGETFTIGDLKYTVLTEEGSTGTVSVVWCNWAHDIIIPSSIVNNGITYSVTSIGERAFNSNFYLRSIIIPDSVTEIRSGAFHDCYNLTSIVIPDSVTSIGGYAFSSCRSLTSIVIGNSVTSIGTGAFIDCISLLDIFYRGDIIENNYSLYTLLYHSYNNDFKIYYPEENPSWEAVVENGKWRNYNVVPYPVDDLIYKVLTRESTEITLAVTSYMGTSTNVVIPASFGDNGVTCYVTEIGDQAFYKSKGLQHVDIPSTIKSIGEEAFLGCVDLKEINIPNSVTSIGFGAFAGCRKLESVVFEGNTKLESSVFYDCQLLSKVVFPDVFEEIEAYTFARCDQLQSIHIPDAVTYIGDSAFYRCRSLTEIIIPESVTEIGDSVFASCTNLASVIIPDSVAFIGSFVFNGCDQLPSIMFSTGEKILVRYSPSNKGSSYTIPDTVTYIAGSAFFRCADLESIKIPDTVTGIGDNAFCGCQRLTEIEIPNSVISIGNCSFDTCDSLKNIIIPDNVISIGNYIFYNCSCLESVDIGRYVQSIEYTMFSGCTNLLNITVNPDNPVYSSLDGVLFNKTQSHLIVCPAGRKGTYTLPDNVNIIEGYAFSCCSGLTNITIPGSVVFIGDGAFTSCGSLTSVYYQGDVPIVMFDYYPHRYAYPSCIYYDTPDSLISYYPLENASWDVVISSDEWQERKTAGMAAESFWSGELHYFVLGRDETTGIVSVQGASSQKEIIIPDFVENDGIIYRVTRIGACAFNGNSNLESITIPDSVISIGDYAFAECKSLTGMTIPDSIISIGDNAFSECRSLTSVVIPDSVAFLGDNAFQNCWQLSEVVIGNGVTSIGSQVFYNCGNLADIIINSDVVVNSFNFSDLRILKRVTIGDSVTSIRDDAFRGCSSLTSVVIGNGVTSIGECAFYECNSLISVVIGNGVTSIGDYAFGICSSLTSVVIPDSVTSIGEYAFSYGNNLTSVYFKGDAPNFGNLAFYHGNPDNYHNTKTTIYYLKGTSGWSNFCWGSCPIVECGGWITQDGIIYVYQSDGTASVAEYTGEIDIVVIPEVISVDFVDYRVTSIGDYAFYECNSLISVVIPDSVISIGRAFYDCYRLVSVYFEGNAPSLGNPSFYSVPATVYYLKGTEGWTDSWGGRPSVECDGWITQNGIIYVCQSDGKASVVGYVKGIDVVIIPEIISVDTVDYSVVSIGEYAFSECNSLTSIVIPDSVTSIGSYAFDRCTSLISITIPDRVSFIERSTFIRCSNLINVTIPDSVTSIDNYAFYNCSSLTSVYFEGNAPSVGLSVFSDTPTTVYYRAGTRGWTNPWGGRPTALWVEAPEITEQPQSQSAVEGNPVTFTVSTTGTAPLSYQWQKDGVDIIGAIDASYTIDNVKPTDAGSYTVMVSNSAGSVTSGVAVLTVRYLGTATISMNSVNTVIYGDSCGPLAGQKVSSDIWGALLYNGQEIARQVFSFAAAGKPTGKLKGEVIETDLVPAGTEVTLQLAAFDQGYLDHPDTGHYYYGISKPFTYKTGDSKTIQPDNNLLFDSFSIEWVETPVDEPVIRFELEGDGESLVLDFVGTLYESDDAVNWYPVEGAKAPFKVDITHGKKFYRCAQ